jgi:hypothetical protein
LGEVEVRTTVKDLDIGAARYLNLALASWLLVSAFLWRHSEPQFLVTILVGAIVAIVAPFEIDSPVVRKVTTGAGAVLALAAVGLPRTTALTLWHNLLLGLAMVVISFFGPPHGLMRPRPPAPADAYEGTGGV